MPNLHVGILKCMKERLRHLANQLSIKCSLGKCSAGCDLWPFASRLDLFKLRNELSLSTNIEIVFVISTRLPMQPVPIKNDLMLQRRTCKIEVLAY